MTLIDRTTHTAAWVRRGLMFTLVVWLAGNGPLPVDARGQPAGPSQAGKAPDSLADFPHNPFGARLRQVGESLRRAGRKADIGVRIQLVAREDSDHDGVDNLTEILLGHSPGDPADVPAIAERSRAAMVREEFAHFLISQAL